MSFIILYIIIENHKITFHGFIHFNYTQSGNVKRYEGGSLLDIQYVKNPNNEKIGEQYNVTEQYTYNQGTNNEYCEYYVNTNSEHFPGFELSSKGAKDDNMPLIFVCYYPSSPNNPVYFNFDKTYETRYYNFYIRGTNIKNYEHFDNEGPLDTENTFIEKIQIGAKINKGMADYNKYGEINDFVGSNYIGTVSVTDEPDSFVVNNNYVDVYVDVYTDNPGQELGRGYADLEFVLIPKDNNIDDYLNYPMVDAEEDTSSTTMDNEFILQPLGNTMELGPINTSGKILITFSGRMVLTLEVAYQLEYGWSIGTLNDYVVYAKNRYSTTIPYLRVHFNINLNN